MIDLEEIRESLRKMKQLVANLWESKHQAYSLEKNTKFW